MRDPVFAESLLRWYGENGRDLPWRRTRDPYAIWLSEIILQQTRIAQGMAYWERFMARFPSVNDLAAASEDEVLRLWEGLGYYSRLGTCMPQPGRSFPSAAFRRRWKASVR